MQKKQRHMGAVLSEGCLLGLDTLEGPTRRWNRCILQKKFKNLENSKERHFISAQRLRKSCDSRQQDEVGEILEWLLFRRGR